MAAAETPRVKALVIVALLIFPFVTPSAYSVSLMTQIYILALFALSYDILIGYTGLVSFGHSLPYGIGAYGVTMLMLVYGVSPLPAYAISLALVLAVSILVGMIALRLTGIFFAIITLAFAQLVYVFVIQGPAITGGADGIPGMGRPEILSMVPIHPSVSFYFYTLAFLLITYLITRRLLRSPFGRVFQAIKENEERVRMLGVNTYWYKVASFAITGVFAGVAGILHVQYLGFTDPGMFYWTQTGDVLFVTLIGGMGTLIGPIVGAATLVFFEDFMAETFRPEAGRFFLGVAFVLVILYLPEGVIGAFERYGVVRRIEERLSWRPIPGASGSEDDK